MLTPPQIYSNAKIVGVLRAVARHDAMSIRPRYKLSFTTGGLFQSESLAIARLYLENDDWDEAVRRSLSGVVFAQAKSASMRRAAREIANRLATMECAELDFLIRAADAADQAALLWISTCRYYRLIREFASEIVQERYLSHQLQLQPERFDVFFADKAEWDEGVASATPATKVRARQVLFRMMRQAGVINDDNRILRVRLSPPLRELVRRNGADDLACLPGAALDRCKQA